MPSAIAPVRARSASNREWRRGWPIVLGAATMFATGPGLYQNISSAFIPALEARFGWSRGDIATAAGIGLLAALAAPFIGRIVDRFGAVPVIVASALILGAAHAWLASMSGGLWQFQLGVGLLALSAPGLSALVFGKLIARRFDAHRGFALGVATSGISVTTLLLPPVVAAVIAASDWRFGYLLLGGLAMLVGLPVALLAIRVTRLEPLLQARGRRYPPQSAVPGIAATPDIAAADARRSGNFWRIAVALLLVNMATIGLVTQLVPFGRDRGLGDAGAALLVSAYALSQITGRLGMGALVDRFPAPLMAGLACLVSAFGFAILFVPDDPASGRAGRHFPGRPDGRRRA